MSLRIKLFISFLGILILVIVLLSVNSFMVNSKNYHMKRLLWIHHQYTSLLNLKIAVNLQRTEAQEIFIYGKAADLQNFQEITDVVKKEVSDLVEAESKEGSANPGTDDPSLEIAMEKQRLIEIQHGYEDLYRELLLLSKLIQVGRKAKAKEHFSKEIGGRFQKFFSQIDTWSELEEKKLSQVQAGFVKLSNRHNLASIIGLSIILIVVLAYFVMFIYLLGPRLKELFLGTRRIADGDFTKPIAEKGNDEFTNLARAMNQTMKSLAESRKKLLEQSYYSGIADMVSGALHNVKNSLSPVLIDIEIMEKDIVNFKSGNLLNAATQLSQQDKTAEKQEDLVEYIGLSCEKLDKNAVHFSQTLAAMRNKIDLINKVLSDHEKFAGAERPMEVVSLQELIQDSIALVSKEYLDSADITIDPVILEITAIKTQRILMIQVLANLIVNSVESIIRVGGKDGEISIEATQEGPADQKVTHIKIRDNGEGIGSDRIKEIFQRGVSSKQGSFGLGLHWCANTVVSLDGKLYAESEGVGQGACLNLIV